MMYAPITLHVSPPYSPYGSLKSHGRAKFEQPFTSHMYAYTGIRRKRETLSIGVFASIVKDSAYACREKKARVASGAVQASFPLGLDIQAERW